MTEPLDSSVNANPATGMWEFVAPDEYHVPKTPAHSAVADAWTSLKRILLPASDHSDTPIKQEFDLRALTEVRLAHLVPDLSWAGPAEALGKALAESQANVHVVVGQPFCGHPEILKTWAEQQGAVVIEPPPPEALLQGDVQWLDQWPSDGRLWLVPELERWYLRHTNGLSLIRELLYRVGKQQSGTGVLGCDSWALAYLKKTAALVFPNALTLQSFDATRLSEVFSSIEAPPPLTSVRFRNARRGNDILEFPLKDDPVDSEIVQLAAHCRGNVGTALAYWRERLRSEPEREEAATTDIDAEENLGPSAAALEVWVGDIKPDPLFPTAGEEDTAILLHTLLLHHGVTEALLPELLPMPGYRSKSLLLRLQNSNLVQLRDDRWYVTELAYSAVRRLMLERKFLTDDF